MKYTASRLSEGNKMFPDEIIIDDNSVTVKSPKLFGGVSKSFPLGQISITINTPMIGYSDITLISQGTRMSVHGFTSSDAQEIKFAIERGSANQQEEARRLEKTKRKEEDDAWMEELKRKSQHNSEYRKPYDTAYEEDSERNLNLSDQTIHDDCALNMQALNNLYDRMLIQAKLESRELTEFEKISIESIKVTLRGNGGKLNKEYFASSNAHNRASYTGINDHMSAEEHFIAYCELKMLEEHWNLSPRLRAEQNRKEKEAVEDLKNSNEDIPASQILDMTDNPADMIKMSEEILSRLESETGEKFYLLPEFEKFTLKDEPLQTGFLLANENLQSIRLNYTVDEKLYSVTYWKPDGKENKFTNYLAHLTYDIALKDIITYYKNPTIKNLIEYAEFPLEFGNDSRNIYQKIEDMERKLIDGEYNSLIITGEPDLYTSEIFRRSVIDEPSGLIINKVFFTITGELNSFELYNNLYKYNGNIILMHNTDNSLRDESFLNVFRQAIAAQKNRLLKRPVNNTITDFDLKVLDEFWFSGKIIFISSIPLRKLVPLLGQQSNIIDVTRNKEDKIFSLWGHIPIFEIPTGRVKERIKRKAMEIYEEVAKETDNVELSLRSLQKAILIVNAFGMDNDEICRNLIKQQCSIPSD